MPVFLSILRGINVGGQKKIEMPALKALYAELGFQNIRNYIQSGNIIFEAEETPNMAHKIEEKIIQKFHFYVPVLIRNFTELSGLITKNPFLQTKEIMVDKLHLTFLAEEPSSEDITAVSKLDFTPDRFQITKKAIYLYCPNGYGKTKLNNTFWENKLKTIATTRNWNTVTQLYNLMKTDS